MPIVFAADKTPKGNPFVRTMSSGAVTAADAQALNAALVPGQPLSGLALLGVVAPGASFSAEARQAFTTGNNDPTAKRMPVAVVVSSAPLRVMISFIIRIAGSADETRFFSNEAEALAWIDEKLSATP